MLDMAAQDEEKRLFHARDSSSRHGEAQGAFYSYLCTYDFYEVLMYLTTALSNGDNAIKGL